LQLVGNKNNTSVDAILAGAFLWRFPKSGYRVDVYCRIYSACWKYRLWKWTPSV